MRTFERPMGLYATAQTLILTTCYQVWPLENMLKKGQILKDCDKIYVPRRTWMTGQLDLHDLALAVPTASKDKVRVVDARKTIRDLQKNKVPVL